MPEAAEAGAWWGIAATTAASLLAVWTAAACLRNRRPELSGRDAIFWGALALVFFTYSQIKLAKDLGWLHGSGEWIRDLARAYALYDDRRPFQIAVTAVIALAALCVFLYGVYWMAPVLKRYRLAFGFAALAVGCAMIRLVSLHEIDGWFVELPWLRPAFDLIGAGGASLAALSRLHSLGEYTHIMNWLTRTGAPAGKSPPE